MPNAPKSMPLTDGTGRPRPGRLLWLTALVGLGHWLFLTGLPAAKTLGDTPLASEALFVTLQPVDAPQQAPIPAAPQTVRTTDPTEPGSKPPAQLATAAGIPIGAGTGPSRDAAEPALDASVLSDAAGMAGDTEVVDRQAAGMGKEADLLLALANTEGQDGPSATNPAPYRFSFPEPVRIVYEAQGRSGFAYTASAEILWQRDSNSYQAALRVSKLGIPLSVWTSKGSLGAQGVAPLRFGEKKGRSSEIAAHFQRDKGIISFSRNAPNVALQVAAQDHLSTFFQLSSMVAAEPARFTPGSAIAFQSANAYGAQDWTFKVGSLDNLGLPAPAASGLRLTRDHSADYDIKVEVWLAPTLGYLPVRIRLSQTNGDFLELVARTTEIPQ